jgi:hypothetical protein
LAGARSGQSEKMNKEEKKMGMGEWDGKREWKQKKLVEGNVMIRGDGSRYEG